MKFCRKEIKEVMTSFKTVALSLQKFSNEMWKAFKSLESCEIKSGSQSMVLV